MQPATTSRAATVCIAWRGVFDDLARERLWQRRAYRLVVILGVSVRLGRGVRFRGLFLLIGK
jgi:hypothetical protein